MGNSSTPGTTGERREVLVADAEPCRVSAMVDALRGRQIPAHGCLTLTSLKAALAGRRCALIVLGTSLDITNKVRRAAPGIPLVMVLKRNSPPDAARCLKQGAVAAVNGAPLNLAELFQTVEKVLSPESRVLSPGSMVPSPESMTKPAAPLIGAAPCWLAALARARKFAGTEHPVLIVGETGTGKELVADLVHRESRRRGKQLVAINCAALPEHLLESELFGHVKGAFTGAHEHKTGLLEFADGGSVFLDEVSSLPLALQPKLLRFLQDKLVRKVGGTASARADVRLIAATNEDLEAKVARREFRADLMYRLEVHRVDLPPLRARAGDVKMLAEHFLSSVLSPQSSVSAAAWAALYSYSWPGNVRELENALCAAATLCEGGVIQKEDLPARVQAAV